MFDTFSSAVSSYQLGMTRLVSSCTSVARGLGISVMLSGCATAGATYRSGVGDTFLEQAPFYAGVSAADLGRDTSRLGHVPIVFQRGATQPASFDLRATVGTPMDSLIREMNVYLESLAVSERLIDEANATAAPKGAIAPDVQFGCIPDLADPDRECAERDQAALGRGRQPMRLAVGRPSADWITWARPRMEAHGVSRTLVITLEVGQYFLRQVGVAGRKSLELGTNHRVELPWLTSLETPVSVLQFTAAVVGADGKAIRIGAEGFYPRRTSMVISAVGGQQILTDDDVRTVRTARRDELLGKPLAWHVALRELVQGVTGRAIPVNTTR